MATPADLGIAAGGAWSDEARLQAVVAAARCQDQAALRELYLLTGARLLHILRENVDAALVEDVLVATYCRVWRDDVVERRREAGVMSWLTRLAFYELVALQRQAGA